MLAYHGTVVNGIKTLKPYAHPLSNLQQPVVYFSTIKALSAIYIWDKGYKWMTYDIRNDGMPVYNETFKDGLSYFYSGVKGYIYECDADFSPEKDNTRTNIVISNVPVDVQRVEFVEDVYERILKFEKEGQLIINHFEELTDDIKRKERKIVLDSIKNLELLKRERPLSDFVAEKFPDLWDEALHKL